MAALIASIAPTHRPCLSTTVNTIALFPAFRAMLWTSPVFLLARANCLHYGISLSIAGQCSISAILALKASSSLISWRMLCCSSFSRREGPCFLVLSFVDNLANLGIDRVMVHPYRLAAFSEPLIAAQQANHQAHLSPHPSLC